jgi:hypothetical protein
VAHRVWHFVATIANHAMAGAPAPGSPPLRRADASLILGVSFIAMAVDADLDKLDDEDAKAPPRFACHHCGVFPGRDGRQNQIATVMLAARFDAYARWLAPRWNDGWPTHQVSGWERSRAWCRCGWCTLFSALFFCRRWRW